MSTQHVQNSGSGSDGRRTEPESHTASFQAFPTEVLPETVGDFVMAAAKAIGCDCSYVALPALAGLSAAIGNTRRVELKRSWLAPPNIWTVVVGESGTHKSPAFSLVMRPFRELQEQALMRFAAREEDYRQQFAIHERDYSAWKSRRKSTDPPPQPPEAPSPERFVVSDTTVEALAPLLLANPRGLFLARDELSGWFGSFDRYASGRGGSDVAHWLSMFNAEAMMVDRKTGQPRQIYVPRASLSICGGIQPSVLRRVLGTRHQESGLAARFVMAFPPRTPKRWTDAQIPHSCAAAFATLIANLYRLQPDIDQYGELCPVAVQLTPAAMKVWREFYDHHAHEQVEVSGELSAAWSKLEEYAARFALVDHCIRHVGCDAQASWPEQVGVLSIESGIKLVSWFKQEARRIYAMLNESPQEQAQRELINFVIRKGGTVTVREVQAGCRRYRESRDTAEAALHELVKKKLGIWRERALGKNGGRPCHEFALSSVNRTGEIPGKTAGSVDVDTEAHPATKQNHDDWGEA